MTNHPKDYSFDLSLSSELMIFDNLSIIFLVKFKLFLLYCYLIKMIDLFLVYYIYYSQDES